MISTRIKELRIEKSLTQKELADFLNLTPKMQEGNWFILQKQKSPCTRN